MDWRGNQESLARRSAPSLIASSVSTLTSSTFSTSSTLYGRRDNLDDTRLDADIWDVTEAIQILRQISRDTLAYGYAPALVSVLKLAESILVLVQVLIYSSSY